VQRKFSPGPLGLLILLFCLSFWPQGAGAEQLRYTISWHGLEDPELEQTLRAVSNTAQYIETPPASLGLLRQRIKEDIPRLQQVLQARGHFKAQISHQIDLQASPVEIRFRVIPGPQFALEKIVFRSERPLPKQVGFPTPEQLRLSPGSGITTEALVRGRRLAESYFRDRGWPFAEVQKPEATADHATATVSVVYPVSPGPRLRFGPLRLEGLNRVNPVHVRRQVAWGNGAWYNATQVDATERALLQSGLFTTAAIRRGEAGEGDMALPLSLQLRERKPRTVKAGVEYTSDFAFGTQLSWEHRNLFGRGERLQTQAKYNAAQKTLESSLRFPSFLDPAQELVLSSDLTEEDTDAYTSRHLRNSVRLERQLTTSLRGGLGIGHEYLEQEEDDTTDIFNLISVPLFLDWDQRNDILNPTHGYRLQIHATPYQDIADETGNFFKYKATGSLYIPLMAGPRLVWAGQAGFGQILGRTGAVPTSKRFFPGGGGSIRGFRYQSAGPLASDDTPLGGRSVLELSSEFRIALSDKWGGTVFVDTGRAYSDIEPETREELFWGAGIGLRYYSGIGPLRLDVATPLNPREGTDDPLQFYFSIGQAF
jgi:translocation and assembly module TamA